MKNDLFEKEAIHKAYFHFAIPVVLGMVVSLIYNMMDTYFIAQTHNTNLIAGVSIGAPVFTLMIALGDIFGLGGSSVISRLFGQQDMEHGKRISAFSFYAAIVIGCVVAAILLIFRTPILYLLGADADTMQYASQYFTGIVLGAPAIILTFTPSNQLRTEGLAKQSMIGTILGAVINMILDPIFILALGWGATGAAVASVIGYICTDIYFIWVLQKQSKQLSAKLSLCHISKIDLKEILVIGFPASVTNLMQSLSIALTNRSLLPYGNDKIAAMGIVMKINMIVVLVLVGFAFGGQPLFGYNYGAKNYKRLRSAMKFSYLFEIGLATILGGLLAIFGGHLVKLFINDEAIVASGTLMLRLLLSGIIFMAIVLVTTCIFQSTGKALGAFILSVSRQGVLFAIIIVIASRCFGYIGVLISQALSDAITGIIAVVLLYNTLWKELRSN